MLASGRIALHATRSNEVHLQELRQGDNHVWWEYLLRSEAPGEMLLILALDSEEPSVEAEEEGEEGNVLELAYGQHEQMSGTYGSCDKIFFRGTTCCGWWSREKHF